MAQSNFEERIDTYEIESTNVMTGDRDRSRYLYYQLKMSITLCSSNQYFISIYPLPILKKYLHYQNNIFVLKHSQDFLFI